MVNIEIELLSADAKNDIYDLRNFLEKHIDNLQLSLKEQPAMEGEMSLFSAETILNGVIHAGVGIGIERCIHILWPLMKEWISQIGKQSDRKVGILATLGDSSSSVTISEDSDGTSQRYDNVSYSINKARTRAILIGCGEFEYDFPAISPVKGNLEDLYRVLIDKRNIGLPSENITIVLDKRSNEIEEALIQVSKLPDTETLIVYFSGHGYRSDVDRLYLIAKNTRKVDDYILNGIDYNFIKNAILKSSPAKQKIVILDACHSGIATQGVNDTILEMNVTGSYVLASSESDEVSYYDKSKRHTFFTGALLEVLSRGIDNEKEMLSLQDLYDYSRGHLGQTQQPRFKDKLSISPADFFLARNPSFSLEKNLRKAISLYNAGKLANALTEFKKILQRQPDNTEVKKLADQCNNELLFVQFAKEADSLFYKGRNYAKALELYQQAYDLKKDYSIAAKIEACKEHIASGNTTVITPKGEEEEDEMNVEKKEKPQRIGLIKKLFALGITLAVVAIGWLILILIKGHGDNTSIAELKNMLDTDTEKALTKLQKSSKKDSANYILGNFYRDEERYDTAAHFYREAINASHLPAAYSALAQMYYDQHLDDSSDNRIAYSILHAADSLYKADTNADNLLGLISAWRIRFGEVVGIKYSYTPDKEPEDYYQRAIKKGCQRCVTNLAFFYLTQAGLNDAAFRYMKQAAENNETRAQVYLSDMYERGIGTVSNKEEADKWFKLYLENANVEELISSSDMFMSEYGADKNYMFQKNCKKAIELLKVIESKTAMITSQFKLGKLYYKLGSLYEEGCDTNVPKDLKKAIEYYKKGANLFDYFSQSALDRLKVKY